jgi:GST-like protein
VQYLAGEFSIADIMNVTWPRALKVFFGMDISGYPNLTRWIAELEARPAVQKAFAMKPS